MACILVSNCLWNQSNVLLGPLNSANPAYKFMQGIVSFSVDLYIQARESLVAKKRSILISQQEQARRRRHAAPEQPSMFSRLVASVTGDRDATSVSIQSLTSEVKPQPPLLIALTLVVV